MIKKVLTFTLALLLSFVGVSHAQVSIASTDTLSTLTWIGQPNLFATTSSPYMYESDPENIIEDVWSQSDKVNLDSLPSLRLEGAIIRIIDENFSVIKYTLSTLIGNQFTGGTVSWQDTINNDASYFIPATKPVASGQLAVDSVWLIDYNGGSVQPAVGDKFEIGISHYRSLEASNHGRLLSASMSHEQEMVEDGLAFTTSFDSVMATNETIKFGIFPNSETDLEYFIESTDKFTIVLFESPIDSLFGGTLSSVNRNRESQETTPMVVTKNLLPKVGGDGTQLIKKRSDGLNQVGSVYGLYWALDPNKKYYMLITSLANGNSITTQLEYHREE